MKNMRKNGFQKPLSKSQIIFWTVFFINSLLFIFIYLPSLDKLQMVKKYFLKKYFN